MKFDIKHDVRKRSIDTGVVGPAISSGQAQEVESGRDEGRTAIAVQLHSVGKTYRTGERSFIALSEINLRIESGDFLAIVGKSGSGKSTLLNLLTGIDRATSGLVRVNGDDLGKMSENELARWRGRNVGLVFQFQQLMPTLTILENVMMPMDFVGEVPRKLRTQRGLDLLERVGVVDQAEKFPSQLSGGQQQRVAIARSLANDPPILAADEPTGNLDSAAADSILQLFRDLADEGTAVVMVTHEREIAVTVDRVITIVDGRIDSCDD